MNTDVVDRPERNRYEILADDEVAGSAFYSVSDGTITFSHTEVDDAYEGQGLGSTLVKAALDDARKKGLKVRPACPFVKAYIERHEEYRDLVA